MWSSKVHQHLLLHTRRNLSLTAIASVSHYDVLGITPKATQAEVKAAYYKLSKLHHPDILGKEENDGDKFRLISEAYEVLGNHRSRQLYDKGLYGHSRMTENRKDVTPDHPNIGFYRSRFDKSHAPTTQASHKIYNFDEWTRQHYSETFAKTNIKHKEQRRHINHDPREPLSHDPLLTLSLITFLFILLGYSTMSAVSLGYDTPKINKKVTDEPV